MISISDIAPGSSKVTGALTSCSPHPPSRVPLEVFPRSCGWASLLHLCLCIGKGRPKRWSRSRTARSVPTACPIATPSRSQLAIGICSLKPPRYSDALLPLPGSIAGFYRLTAPLRSKCAPFIPSILETRRIPVHNLFWFPNHS